MKLAPVIPLSDSERKTMETWSRRRSTQARRVLRAKIVRMAAEGKTNETIAAELKTSKPTVRSLLGIKLGRKGWPEVAPNGQKWPSQQKELRRLMALFKCRKNNDLRVAALSYVELPGGLARRLNGRLSNPSANQGSHHELPPARPSGDQPPGT